MMCSLDPVSLVLGGLGMNCHGDVLVGCYPDKDMLYQGGYQWACFGGSNVCSRLSGCLDYVEGGKYIWMDIGLPLKGM